MSRSGGNRRKLAETLFGGPIAVRKYSQAPGSGRRAELLAIGVSLAETAETPTRSRTRVSCRSSETSETSETSIGGQDPVVHRGQIRRHKVLALRQACDLARLDVNIEKTGAMLVLGHVPYPGIHLKE